MRAYVDSDALIWHVRGNRRATAFFQRLAASREEIWIGAMQRAEVVFHLLPHEVVDTQELLLRFNTHPVTEEIVDFGATLYRQWHPSHGADVNDCILAATVMLTGGKIYTLNTKHYPMPDIVAVRAW
jgi:hypothetical protein